MLTIILFCFILKTDIVANRMFGSNVHQTSYLKLLLWEKLKMNFLKKNILTISLALIFCLGLGSAEALAQTQMIEDGRSTVFYTAMSKGSDTFQAVKSLIFLVGGFGLVALAFFAVFGKLKWTWFASLAVGLAILAAAGAIIDYATNTNGVGTSTANTGSWTGDSLTGSPTQVKP